MKEPAVDYSAFSQLSSKDLAEYIAIGHTYEIRPEHPECFDHDIRCRYAAILLRERGL